MSLASQKSPTEKNIANEKAPGHVTPSNQAAGSNISESQTFLDKLPAWVSINLRSKKSRKLWIRCWVASWVGFVILLPNKSLAVLGNAAFFTLLASLMLPPNVSVQLFLFLAIMVTLGLCLGWAIGAAGMAAALAARNQLALKESLQREQESVAGLSNPDALFQADIFEGDFLDTRSSVVFGVFLGFGTFLFALIRAYTPKLTLMSVFATIAIDIFCSYGPLFPFAQYTILNSFLISIACYVGLGIIVTIFIFPETMNHSLLGSNSDLLDQIKSLIDIQQEILKSQPSDLASGSPLLTKVLGLRAALVGKHQQMAASSKFVTFEFSYGKWNGDDVKALEEPLLSVISRLGAMQSFAALVGHPASRSLDESTDSLPSEDETASNDSVLSESYLLRQIRARHQAGELQYSVSITDILPLIQSSTEDLRKACSDAIEAVKTVIESVNRKRYSKTCDKDVEQAVGNLSNAIGKLRRASAEFKESKRLQLAEPFLPIIEEAKKTHQKLPIPLRSLYIAYVFGANLIVLTEGILDLMDTVQTIATKRKRNRIWAPSSLRAIGKAITSRGDVSDQALGEDPLVEKDQETERDEKSYRLDPDSKPPTNFFQHTFNSLHYGYKWSKTPEALFAFKYVIITIALWLPSVIRSSAHFVYAQKGLWALIMAQTTLNIYASDQIFNYAMRILGTFIGALLGLLNWYIGSAKSNGSPFGAAASVAVFLVPMVFLRLFSPPQFLPGALLIAVTWGLVMGYSWLDGHIFVFGNVGIGWSIVWRRWVTVMIGCAGSFIIMMFPPKSGRKAVRLRNASIVTSISYLYSTLISAWINNKEQLEGDKGMTVIPDLRERMVAVAAQLQAAKAQTEIAKWEGSIRGAWPYEEYVKLEEIESQMIVGLTLLGASLSHLDRAVRVQFLQHTRSVNPNFIADVMATFSMISQALRTGEPLHEASQQNLLDRIHYHGTVATQSLAQENGEPYQDPLEAITNYDFMFYASAVIAVFQLLDGLHELRRITVRLVGEVPLQGFSRWRNEFERVHVLV